MSGRDDEAARIFRAVIGLPPSERSGFLDAACAGDGVIRRRVEHFLALDADNDTFSIPTGLTDSLTRTGLSSSRTSPFSESLVGQQIGRYRLMRLIASGGMGTVYEAEQEQPQRVVALKLMKGGIESNSAARRFEYESEILARLRHPGIAQVYEAGTAQLLTVGMPIELPYYAMELITGGLPITRYADENRLDARRRLALFADVCDSIQHGHRRGILHRDLKPSNILVDESGQAKVIDFGVARAIESDERMTTCHTSPGQLIGTVAYMSPEQCTGFSDDLDARSDVYSLSVVLYQLLIGKLPYDVAHLPVIEAVRVICEQAPVFPRVTRCKLDRDLACIVLRSLEKNRERRYQSAAELGAEIRRYLRGAPIEARRDSIRYLLSKAIQRHQRVLGIGVVLLAAISTAVLGFWAAHEARFKAIRLNAERVAIAERENDLLTLESLASRSNGRISGQPIVQEIVHRMGQRIRDNALSPSESLRFIRSIMHIGYAGRNVQGPDDPYVLIRGNARFGESMGGVNITLKPQVQVDGKLADWTQVPTSRSAATYSTEYRFSGVPPRAGRHVFSGYVEARLSVAAASTNGGPIDEASIALIPVPLDDFDLLIVDQLPEPVIAVIRNDTLAMEFDRNVEIGPAFWSPISPGHSQLQVEVAIPSSSVDLPLRFVARGELDGHAFEGRATVMVYPRAGMKMRWGITTNNVVGVGSFIKVRMDDTQRFVIGLRIRIDQDLPSDCDSIASNSRCQVLLQSDHQIAVKDPEISSYLDVSVERDIAVECRESIPPASQGGAWFEKRG
jgi:serine/threonine protein kinase